MDIEENIQHTYDDPVNEEVIYQNPLLFLKIWEISSEVDYFDTLEKWPWHFHKEVEFLAVIEGHLGVQSKQDYTILGPGDVMILGASQPHRTHKPFQDNLRYVVFQVDLVRHFDESTMPYLYSFSELTRPLDELNYIFKENQNSRKEANSLIVDIYTESQTQQKGYEMAISYSIRKLMLLLLRNDTRNLLNYTDETDLSRLKPVLNYIDSHLTDKIYVEEVSALVNLSYHYFIRYFKKVMGLSFLDYVNYKRIKKSELLLLTSKLSIMEVGYEVGISNMAQFYKLFKRHNQCSPKEFKERMQNEVV
ncbi:AraC family transcriptional regulator [Litchfieldia alkalitelluris]|uniref:AraC family transcriptional regulator n=1 Tax=Litchfieldia alkalitelluris TaxID=304268 RepID=UPI00099604DC|nr:AraC family transcriptional regulator [Litchfieldia alkalitelluris]